MECDELIIFIEFRNKSVEFRTKPITIKNTKNTLKMRTKNVYNKYSKKRNGSKLFVAFKLANCTIFYQYKDYTLFVYKKKKQKPSKCH